MTSALIVSLALLASPGFCSVLNIEAIESRQDHLTQPDFNADADGEFTIDDAGPEPETVSVPKPSLSLVGWHHHLTQPAPVGVAGPLAANLAAPSPAAAGSPASAADHAANAHKAAKVAKQAAKVANRVAEHSIKVTGHAKKALKHALGALHDARVETEGLSDGQKHTLKKAEGHLREATKAADFGKLKKIKDAKDKQKEKMQDDLDKSKTDKTEKEELLEEIEEIREMLKEKGIEDKELHDALDELEEEIKKNDGKNSDETKVEIERLREEVEKMESKEKKEENKEETKKDIVQSLKDSGMEEAKLEGKSKSKSGGKSGEDESVTPVEEKGIDIDTQMPYGDLEPFGREDTAQELTEKSIKESDEMVDQLERAEVAEEKRAVFRALTRLRGAAITSYDGVARSQTGNIDEYNKVHKWRKQHPVHHLADEESDVTKWAFPDNAD